MLEAVENFLDNRRKRKTGARRGERVRGGALSG